MNALVTALTAAAVLGTLCLSLVLLGRWYLRHCDRQRCLILELLAEGPTRGLVLVKKSGGRLKRGSVYIHLMRLEDMGLVSSECMTGDSGRRIYSLTDAGKLIQKRLEQAP